MKIVMTLMVRDEADIVGAMLEHHRDQGVDHVVVTDNGSIDGTGDILRSFEQEGFITLWHDPVHRKQQFATVTRMARYAAADLAADWVLNADADEFWLASDRSTTLREALSAIDSSVPVVTVPVINLTGAPARRGSGLGRLRYRDLRIGDDLHRSGIPFPPTSDAAHRASPDVTVSQGNHFVSAPGWPEDAVATDLIEVLHLPWRSWAQYEHKVRVSGEAYMANPELRPSPRHHGMQDFRRWQAGRLENTYLAKHPLAHEFEELIASGALVEDDALDRLATAGVPGVEPDVLYDGAVAAEAALIGRRFAEVEAAASARVDEIQAWHDLAVAQRDDAQAQLARITAERDELAALLAAANRGLAVRAANKIASMTRGALHRSGG